jgi:hypothetical protein
VPFEGFFERRRGEHRIDAGDLEKKKKSQSKKHLIETIDTLDINHAQTQTKPHATLLLGRRKQNAKKGAKKKEKKKKRKKKRRKKKKKKKPKKAKKAKNMCAGFNHFTSSAINKNRPLHTKSKNTGKKKKKKKKKIDSSICNQTKIILSFQCIWRREERRCRRGERRQATTTASQTRPH